MVGRKAARAAGMLMILGQLCALNVVLTLLSHMRMRNSTKCKYIIQLG